jgi:hypothetical protein
MSKGKRRVITLVLIRLKQVASASSVLKESKSKKETAFANG